jgi:putative ABC transport system permease protein
MRRLRAWGIRLGGMITRRRRVEQFDEELQSILEMHVDEGLRRGLSPDEARRNAHIAIGGMHVRDTYRDRGSMPWLEFLMQDVRFAVRMLRKSPGFTLVAVLILAVGIGANGAMFSLVNGLLLKPLNGGSTSPLFGLHSGERSTPDRFRGFSYPEYVDIRDQNTVFASLLAESVARSGLTEGGLTRRVSAGVVSSNYFSTLGVTMAAGRAFTLDEERPGSAAAVAVVSYPFWLERGLRPDVVGQRITVNAHELTIVGVAPEGFSGTMPVLSMDLWLPFGAASFVESRAAFGPSARVVNDRSVQTLLVAGILKDGQTAASAESQLASLASALERAYPEHNRDQRFVVAPRSRVNMGPRPRSDSGPAAGAAVLMAVASLVLLVACLNLANILLARGSVRKQEIAVRLALGGSRLRIVQQLLIEGLLLSVMGGAAALLIAGWASTGLLSTLSTTALPVRVALDTSLDGRVVMAVLVACLASTAAFALLPAWSLSKADLVLALKQSVAARLPHRRRLSAPTLLVGTQIALSMALLVGAGVFVRAGINVSTADPGFPLPGGMLAEIDVGIAGFDDTRGRAAYAAVLDVIRAVPGVRAASGASMVPFGSVRIDRQVTRGSATMAATFTVIGADYFAALGLPLVAGREFVESEERDPAAEPVAIVDRLLAERLFSGENALGQSVRLSVPDAPLGEFLRIVGIVPTVQDDVLEQPSAHIYVPSGRHYQSAMTVHVRTAPGGEGAMLESVRRAIHRVDARLPIVSLRTMTNHRDASTSLWAVFLIAQLFAAFGTIALVLATVGVYGLRAYMVAQRTREMGIRIALGATRREVIRQLLGESVPMTATALLAGAALGLGLIQVLRASGMLFEVSSTDPFVFTIAPLVLAAATAAASYIPVRRAVGIDPAHTLRSE